jgi:hypothetical protein
MSLSSEWDEDSKKYVNKMIDAALNENIAIIMARFHKSLMECHLQARASYYRIYIDNDDMNKVVELLRSRNCCITWDILVWKYLNFLPIANGDILKINFDIYKFDEQFEDLLELVTKVRIAKIFNNTRERLKDEQYELLQILANKGGTVIEHNISD